MRRPTCPAHQVPTLPPLLLSSDDLDRLLALTKRQDGDSRLMGLLARPRRTNKEVAAAESAPHKQQNNDAAAMVYGSLLRA